MDNNYILRFTGFDIHLRNHLHKYYYNLPESQKLVVDSKVGKISRQYNTYRHDASCSALFHYCCRLMAINTMFEENKRLLKKSQVPQKASTVIRETKLVSHRREKRSFGKKASFIRARLGEIQYLRERRFTWKQISEYAWRHWRLRISPDYLRKVFYDLTSHPSCD